MEQSLNQHENIGELFSAVAKRQGNRIALIEAETKKEISFGAINDTASRYCSYFKSKGLRPGDRVMLLVKPSIDFYILCFSLFKFGAVIIFIDSGMGITNLKKCISHVKPDAVVGIPKAILFRRLFPKAFQTVKQTFCVGFTFGLLGADIRKQVRHCKPQTSNSPATSSDLAAIIFTSGSTGIPKGVLYHHSTFLAQLRLIREFYGITGDDIDLPAFPLFGLFSTALGARAVIPDMDSTRPAQVDPGKYVEAIKKYAVTFSFGSPALWRVVAQYCSSADIKLDPLKLVLIAGAPVPGWLSESMVKVLPESTNLHTPYGATESLPIVSMDGREIVSQTWHQTRDGKGICVGRTLPGIEVAIIPISDDPIESIQEVSFLGEGEIGEIVVRGDVVTTGYDNHPDEDRLAKIMDGASFYHRMGDTGYFDTRGRLWFCGRKSHRVKRREKTMYPICCEAITNEHPNVFRSALVGIPDTANFDYRQPVMIVEPCKDKQINNARLLKEVAQLAAGHELTRDIDHFLIHDDFPVDVRHNAKILREKLAVWAEKELVPIQKRPYSPNSSL